nr:hypothetical protein [Mesorhizobium shangrilense]
MHGEFFRQLRKPLGERVRGPALAQAAEILEGLDEKQVRAATPFAEEKRIAEMRALLRQTTPLCRRFGGSRHRSAGVLQHSVEQRQTDQRPHADPAELQGAYRMPVHQLEQDRVGVVDRHDDLSAISIGRRLAVVSRT